MSFWEGNHPSYDIKNFKDQAQLTTTITERAVDFINRNKVFNIEYLELRNGTYSQRIVTSCLERRHHPSTFPMSTVTAQKTTLGGPRSNSSDLSFLSAPRYKLRYKLRVQVRQVRRE